MLRSTGADGFRCGGGRGSPARVVRVRGNTIGDDPPDEAPRDHSTAPAERHVIHLERSTSELTGTDDILTSRGIACRLETGRRAEWYLV